MGVICSGLSCTVDKVPWKLHGMNDRNKEAQVDRYKESSKW